MHIPLLYLSVLWTWTMAVCATTESHAATTPSSPGSDSDLATGSTAAATTTSIKQIYSIHTPPPFSISTPVISSIPNVTTPRESSFTKAPDFWETISILAGSLAPNATANGTTNGTYLARNSTTTQAPTPLSYLGAQCLPITLPSPIKPCTNTPYYIGKHKLVVTCPHWAYIPRFDKRMVHMNVELYYRAHPRAEWRQTQNFQATRWRRGAGGECGFLRDQKTGEVLYEGCQREWYPGTVVEIAKPVLWKGVWPVIQGMGDWQALLTRYFAVVVDCVNLIRELTPYAGTGE